MPNITKAELEYDNQRLRQQAQQYQAEANSFRQQLLEAQVNAGTLAQRVQAGKEKGTSWKSSMAKEMIAFSKEYGGEGTMRNKLVELGVLEKKQVSINLALTIDETVLPFDEEQPGLAVEQLLALGRWQRTDNNKGLQVLNKQGSEYIPVEVGFASSPLPNQEALNVPQEDLTMDLDTIIAQAEQAQTQINAPADPGDIVGQRVDSFGNIVPA